MDKFDLDWVLSRDEQFRYQLLDRMRTDCGYYLGNGHRLPKCLWAKDEKEHIVTMKAIWNSFPADSKPEWLTWEQIEEFEAAMMPEKHMGSDKMIVYLRGDATDPQADGYKIIAHICNDIGGWGKGFVLAVSKKWDEPEKAYRSWFKTGEGFVLGEVQFVPVAEDIAVANMIGQKGIKSGLECPPIRYEAVKKCLETLTVEAKAKNASIHMPRIGCGLAGGKWEQIELLITSTLVEAGIAVYVYDLDGAPPK